MADAPSPLQEVACLRLLFPLPEHPGAKEPRSLCRHLLEVFVQQRKLVTGRDSGPGMDAGDILCDGKITRGAVLPLQPLQPWDWLDAAIDWQVTGHRPLFQPPPIVDPADPLLTITPRPMALQPPAVLGAAWLGDLGALQSPGVLPLQPRALLAGASLLTAGFPFGEGGIGAELQEALGEEISVVLKPNRVLALQAGDTLQAIAERYGTTVQTLRRLNTHVLALDTVLSAEGDTLLTLAGQYGTTVEWLMANNTTLARWGGHTVVSGDTLLSLAELYLTTPATLRLYNAPTYDFFPRSEPLPLAAVLVAPLVRPSTPLEPGRALLVPRYRPQTLLPYDGWIHLPKPRRSAADPDDRSYLDAPEPESPPEPAP